MPRASGAWVLCLVVACAGCTVMKMQEESNQMTTRIGQKDKELADLGSSQAALAAEKQRLMTEIDTKQMTVDQLDEGLKRLRQENDRLVSANDSQRAEKKRTEEQLAQYQKDIAAIKGDDRLSDQAKRERIESLKKQLRSYLQIMLTQ